MGTRSLTRVHNEMNEILVNMYVQFDGYPDGHGTDLAEFMDGMVVVNGIGMDDNRKIANGAGCFAAQMIANFKTDVGGTYLVPIGDTDCWSEYIYDIYVKPNEPIIIKITCKHDGGYAIFHGSVEEMKAYCLKPTMTEDGSYIKIDEK